MIEQFLNHIQRHQLCKTSDKILLAVSGGVDSMVMLDLFIKAGFRTAVAHCNFLLREEASDADESFVREKCAGTGLPFFSARFETARIASRKNTSIQETARELRYDFFKDVMDQNGFDVLATAHHLNDNLETVLLNLTRGTGLDGISGIPVRNGKIIRPLLFASREMILGYASGHRLEWREDASNDGDDYSRNYVRHHVVPRLKDINPNLENTFRDSIERISAGTSIAGEALSLFFRETVVENDGRITLVKKAIQEHPFRETVLWEFLKKYGFHYDVCKQIIRDHQPGKRFYAGDWMLTIDREVFMIEKRVSGTPEPVVIGSGQASGFFSGMELTLDVREAMNFELDQNPRLAQLDADKIIFPLKWRRWEPGDSMIPLGMNSEKKISDVLTDAKICLSDKEKMTVIQSGSDLIWLVGLRIHDQYKITSGTRRIMVLQVK